MLISVSLNIKSSDLRPNISLRPLRHPTKHEIIQCVLVRSVNLFNVVLHDFRSDSLKMMEVKEDPKSISSIFEQRTASDYKGQGHEGGCDRFVAEVLLPYTHGGTFFEMGAYDGINSNSWYFEYNRSFHGLMIEANTGLWEVAKRNRPRTEILNIAISQEEGYLTEMSGWGGITQTTCSKEKPSEEQLAAHGSKIKSLQTNNPHPEHEDGELGVPCRRMATILKDRGHFDYVSLDCEGCERDAILTWDFEQNQACVVGMESMDEDMTSVMIGQGFTYIGTIVDHYWINVECIYQRNKERWAEFCGIGVTG